MFKILEIVHDGLVELSNRYLPLQFPHRNEAVAHIEVLQAQFLNRGYNDEHVFWWARNDDAAEFYRWTIENGSD